jgi:hypothetical protein
VTERTTRLRSAETGRLRKYEVDAELEDDVLQRLNDDAYALGFEIVSTCAGDTRDEVDDDESLDPMRERAHIAFHIVYTRADVEMQRIAKLVGRRLGADLDGPDTQVETLEEPDWLDWSRSERMRQLGRVFVRASRVMPTKSPAEARTWFREIARRIERSADEIRRAVAAAEGPRPLSTAR